MSKPFDPSKPVQTRCGYPARIICTNANSASPIVALISLPEDRSLPERELPFSYYQNGKLVINHELSYDLVNVPIRHTVWLNIYPNQTVHDEMYDSKDSADNYAKTSRIACVSLTYTEGEGL